MTSRKPTQGFKANLYNTSSNFKAQTLFTDQDEKMHKTTDNFFFNQQKQSSTDLYPHSPINVNKKCVTEESYASTNAQQNANNFFKTGGLSLKNKYLITATTNTNTDAHSHDISHLKEKPNGLSKMLQKTFDGENNNMYNESKKS